MARREELQRLLELADVDDEASLRALLAELRRLNIDDAPEIEQAYSRARQAALALARPVALGLTRGSGRDVGAFWRAVSELRGTRLGLVDVDERVRRLPSDPAERLGHHGRQDAVTAVLELLDLLARMMPPRDE